MGFWEQTWRERSQELERVFGQTEPPDTVTAFTWNESFLCPGACALTLPPIEASRDPLRQQRNDWLYLSLGLSQPLDRKQVAEERAAGKSFSAFGIEFAIVTPTAGPWASEVLDYLVRYVVAGDDIQWGDRFPFGFHRRASGELGAYTGNITGTEIVSVNHLRALVFWPLLFPDSTVLTSTGKFLLMAATGITQGEWDYAKQTTSAHLLLLLCRSGIVQRTLPSRRCLMQTQRWREEAAALERLTPEQCEAEIDAGVGRWHLMPMPDELE
jgi:hypothetical protein